MSSPREQLAAALRDARISAGFASHAALARVLHVSRPVVSKAENSAHPAPSDALLAAWAKATGADLGQVTDLAQRSKSGAPEWFVPFRHAETTARILRYWSPIVVPGPAQTTAYMRALFGDEGHDVAKVDELVTARMERQVLLGRIPVTMIISHHVLYRIVGSPGVMAEQCGYLCSVAERPGVALHVLPERCSTGSYGTFSLATGDTADTVLMEGLRDITSTDHEITGAAALAWERLLGAAAPCGESLEKIRTAEEQWKAQT